MSEFIKYFPTIVSTNNYVVNYPFVGYVDETDKIIFSGNKSGLPLLNGDFVKEYDIIYYSPSKVALGNSNYISHEYANGVGSVVLKQSTIPEFLFANSSITSIELSPNLVGISEGVFEKCLSLSQLTIPKKISHIAANPIKGCSSINRIIVDPENPYYSDLDNSVIYHFDTKSIIAGCNTTDMSILLNDVETIAEEAFISCKDIKHLDTANVKFINSNAFTNSGLTSVTIQSNIQNIEADAFSGCRSIQQLVLNTSQIQPSTLFKDSRSFINSVTIGPLITNIPDGFLSQFSKVTSLTIPEGVNNIGSQAFCFCSQLQSVNIPTSVQTIGANAFYSCYNLESIEIPNSISEIKEYTFQKCSGLTSLDIPDSVTTIGRSAFQSCSNIETLTIGSGVRNIDKHAFSVCSKLSSITFNGMVESIGSETFGYCYSLKSIQLPTGLKEISSYAFCYTPLESITIPSTVEYIASNAFYLCGIINTEMINQSSLSAEENSHWGARVSERKENNLFIAGTKVRRCDYEGVNIIVPDGITEIESLAFYYCAQMESVYLPDSITSIGANAFDNCGQYTMTCSATTPPQLASTLSRVVAIYVPAESIDLYKEQTNWVNHVGKIYAIP